MWPWGPTIKELGPLSEFYGSGAQGAQGEVPKGRPRHRHGPQLKGHTCEGSAEGLGKIHRGICRSENHNGIDIPETPWGLGPTSWEAGTRGPWEAGLWPTRVLEAGIRGWRAEAGGSGAPCRFPVPVFWPAASISPQAHHTPEGSSRPREALSFVQTAWARPGWC